MCPTVILIVTQLLMQEPVGTLAYVADLNPNPQEPLREM